MTDTSSEECPAVSTHFNNVLILSRRLEVEEQSSELGASATASDNAGGTAELEQEGSENSSPEDNLDTESFAESTGENPQPTEGRRACQHIPVEYQFEIPQMFVGLLIGRRGRFVNQVKEATNTIIVIKEHPHDWELKVCSLKGLPANIQKALQTIRERFPTESYPSVTLEKVSLESPVPFAPTCHQVNLKVGSTNHVRLSNLVSAGHFFLHQPGHLTFRHLSLLNERISKYYNETVTPFFPSPVELGTVCAAPIGGEWRRAMVVSIGKNPIFCDIKFLDYGGYSTYEFRFLRRLVDDFAAFPYQAAECYLANVAPIGGKQEWSKEAFEAMEELTKGNELKAEVCGFTSEGIPFADIYVVSDPPVMYINRALADRGLAEWFEPQQDDNFSGEQGSAC